MPLAEKTVENEKLLCRKETISAIGNAEDSGGQLFSADVNSNVRLDENERESKHTVFRGEPTMDQAVKMDAQELNSSFYLVSPENAEDGNESKGDKSHDGEVSPKELTLFERQMALGMVSGFNMFVCSSYYHFNARY